MDIMIQICRAIPIIKTINLEETKIIIQMTGDLLKLILINQEITFHNSQMFLLKASKCKTTDLKISRIK